MTDFHALWADLGRRALQAGDTPLRYLVHEARDLITSAALERNSGTVTWAALELGTNSAMIREGRARGWPDLPAKPRTDFKAQGLMMGILDYTPEGEPVPGSFGVGVLVPNREVPALWLGQHSGAHLRVTLEVLDGE